MLYEVPWRRIQDSVCPRLRALAADADLLDPDSSLAKGASKLLCKTLYPWGYHTPSSVSSCPSRVRGEQF